MYVQFNPTNEVVDLSQFTPQVLLGNPVTKQITYPTANGTAAYTYTGPYYGLNPNDSDAGTNPNQTGHTTPVEGQLRATQSAASTPVGPTGSPLFPLGGGKSRIGFYSQTGVLHTSFIMDDAQSAIDGLALIATSIVAGDDYLYMNADGTGNAS